MMRISLLIVIIALSACSTPKNESIQEKNIEEMNQINSAENSLITSIQEAHNTSDFMREKIVSFDIQLTFGGSERLNARIYSTTNSTKVLVEKANETRLLFDGEQIWIHPKDSIYDGARFDALTWSYFFLAPFKLNDPGTHHTSPQKMPYQNEDSLMTAKMTFGKNVGDAPDDWYVVYQNDSTKRLEAMAYIVTFGDRDPEKAAQNPHAIRYSNYQRVNGIPFAHTWQFTNWSAEEGVLDQLGEAEISNIQFSDDYSVFERNDMAIKIK